jgi:esterase/lipase superfamily enzyme
MAAELQRSLVGKATVLMFSWPSNAGPVEYVRDQADVEWSVPFLADLLTQLGARVGPANVKLLAHSLGTRGALFSLRRLAADSSERPAIGELVLLAPDFDSQTFVDQLPRLTPLVGGITIYASSKDAPLKVSRQLSGYPRLGEGGEFLTVAEGMETIDVSGSGRYQILGHEYFYYHPRVKADLIALLTTGQRAAERPGLRSRTRYAERYWEILQP